MALATAAEWEPWFSFIWDRDFVSASTDVYKRQIKYTIHDDYAIMTMVEAGLGVSILAELMLRRTNFNIACLPIDPPVYRSLAVAYKDSLPIASKYFIDYLLEHAAELP